MARLNDINTSDIPGAIALGCRTMQNTFNADDGGIPFFMADARPVARLAFGATFTEAHVPGRHLNALLTARHLLGLDIDEEAIRKHRRAAFFSLNGPIPLPLCRMAVDAPQTLFVDHNVRETVYALYALVRYRKDDEAHARAAKLIAAVFDLWRPDTSWNLASFRAAGLEVEHRTFIWGLARAIGPLVKYYAATGYGPALELAEVIADKATREFYLADGGFDAKRFGTHTHSATCTLSSLAQLADLRRDHALMSRVLAFYDHGLKTISNPLGWVIEHANDPRGFFDRGEANNTGDVLETSLILGRWGYDRCYDDAERSLRCHLLPSQLRDVSFIVNPPNPENSDGKRDIANRLLGAFGFPAPYGHQPVQMELIEFCLDIVGGAVGSLCEAWRDAVRSDDAGQHVNLLFDREDGPIRVASPYDGGEMTIEVSQPRPLWVRLPSWVDRESLAVRAGGAAHRVFGDRLFFAQPPIDTPIRIAFDIPQRDITLRHTTHDIRVHLRGDTVLSMDHFGADLTYFASIESSVPLAGGVR